MDSEEYRDGRKDWAGHGRLNPAKAVSRDYRRGAQDERTEQVDAELRRLGTKGGKR